MEEIHEHHHDSAGSGWATILTTLLVLVVLGLLLWNFLPIRGENNDASLDVNINPPAGQTQ